MFDSVVAISGAVNVAGVQRTHEVRSTDGHVLCFVRDADSGTVTVRSPGDPAVAVLSPVSAQDVPHAGGDGHPAVDVPACSGSVHMVVGVRRAPPGETVPPPGGGCPGTAAPLGRREIFGGGVKTVVPGAAKRTATLPQQVLRRSHSARHERMILQVRPGMPDSGMAGSNQPTGAPPVAPADTGEAVEPASVAPIREPQTGQESITAPNTAPFDGDELYEQIKLMGAPTSADTIGKLRGPDTLGPDAAAPSGDGPSVQTNSSDRPDFTPIIIGIVAGLVLFLFVAVCVILYRRSSQRGRKAQFTVSKRPDGYEYSHAYAPPASQPHQPPTEAHLSVQAHHPYASHAKQPPHLAYSPAMGFSDLHGPNARGDRGPPSYSYNQHQSHESNGKDPVAASAAAAAYASQSMQPPAVSAQRHVPGSPSSPASPAMYSPQAPTPTHTPPLPSSDYMEEVNDVPSSRGAGRDGDGHRAPVATSQTAPIMSRRHDSKHAARTHKPHKQSTAKARKAAFAAHGAVATSGIAAMHEVPLTEETMPAGDVAALPIANLGTVDDEIQDKIIWLEAQLDAFGSHGVVSDMFKLVPNARLTQEAFVTQHAVGARDQLAFVLTFFLADSHFEAERALYCMPALRGIVPRCEIFADGSSLHGPRGDMLPPCIVFERGETLAEWLRRRSPERPILAEVLAHVALRMRTLHRSGYAHCNISPSTVKWFPQDNMWKLAEFHHAARCGDTRRSGAPGLVGVSPHYAAPETMNKNPQGSASLVSHSAEVTARPALDVWSFGVMALEILCSFRLMDDARDAPPEVLAQLQGATPLPWEAGHASYSAILEKAGDYAGPLLKALNRDPAQRPSVTWITEQWRRVQDSERDPSPTGEFL